MDTAWQKANPLLANRQLRLEKGGVSIDFLAASDNHDKACLQHRRLHRGRGSRYYIVASEDLILLKLKAGRPRDWDDIMSVLLRQKSKTNWTYVRRWARRLGLAEEMTYLETLVKT